MTEAAWEGFTKDAEHADLAAALLELEDVPWPLRRAAAADRPGERLAPDTRSSRDRRAPAADPRRGEGVEAPAPAVQVPEYGDNPERRLRIHDFRWPDHVNPILLDI